MNTLILPEPIARYFAADRHNAEALAHCFSEQAVVEDEGHTYAGIDAIKAWKNAAATQYTYTTKPFALERDDAFQVVHAEVAGSFPGSPINLHYRFRLERGLIASLEITT